MHAEIECLSQYVGSSKVRLMEAVAQENVLKRSEAFKGLDAVRAERKRKLLEKPLHGQFIKATTYVREHRIWSWLRRGQLKKETESLITAAQDQALTSTTYHRHEGYVGIERRLLVI